MDSEEVTMKDFALMLKGFPCESGKDAAWLWRLRSVVCSPGGGSTMRLCAPDHRVSPDWRVHLLGL